MHTISLNIAHHALASSSLFAKCPKLTARCEGCPFKGWCCLHTISLTLASHVLTMSSPFATCPELTASCEGEPFWGCCSLHTIPLPLASHVLDMSSPFATCPDLTARCEGEPFPGCCCLQTISLPSASHVLTISLHLLHAQNSQQAAKGALLGLLLFEYHILTTCLPRPYSFITMCYTPRTASNLRGEPFRGWCCLHTISLPIAHHARTNSLPLATCPKLAARCEGNRFGVAAVCKQYPYQLRTLSWCLQVLLVFVRSSWGA